MKLLHLIVIVFFGTPFFFGQINNDLILHYNFNNGQANDLSGNNLNGSVNATPTTGISGDPNTAMSFNGINNYIELPNDPILKPQLPVTISVVVLLNSNTSTTTSIFTNDFATNSHTGVWINTSSQGMFAANFGDNSGNTSGPNRRSKVGTTILNTGEWYVLTAVIRGANDMDLYVNCRKEEGSYSGSGGSLAYSNQPGSLGRKDSHFNGPVYYLNGVIDEFRFWNRELNSDEITSLCRTLGNEEHVKINEPFELKVYPNPVQEILNLDIDFDGLYVVEIYSIDGKKVKSFNNFQILDVSDIQKGQYFLKILPENSNVQFKPARFIKD
jgi:hypothetical protein